MDSRQLYQEMILDHNKRPRNFGRLPQPSHHAEGVNPLCGDHIELTLDVHEGVIREIAFEGESCAICKASASMMTGQVRGKRLEDARALVQAFRDMAVGGLHPASGPHELGRLTVFSGVRDLPSRVKCAVLPWHTLQAAVSGEALATTEGVQDPQF